MFGVSTSHLGRDPIKRMGKLLYFVEQNEELWLEQEKNKKSELLTALRSWRQRSSPLFKEEKRNSYDNNQRRGKQDTTPEHLDSGHGE